MLNHSSVNAAFRNSLVCDPSKNKKVQSGWYLAIIKSLVCDPFKYYLWGINEVCL